MDEISTLGGIRQKVMEALQELKVHDLPLNTIVLLRLTLWRAFNVRFDAYSKYEAFHMYEVDSATTMYHCLPCPYLQVEESWLRNRLGESGGWGNPHQDKGDAFVKEAEVSTNKLHILYRELALILIIEAVSGPE